MDNLRRVILVACGSFNPVTLMHLRMFELARDYLQKHTGNIVLKGFLSPVSDDYGKEGLISAQHRLAMCNLAVASSDWIQVLPWETEQPNWTPTAEVLKVYAEKFKKEDNAKVVLLCGADVLQSFAVKGLWRESDLQYIVEQHGLAVVTRPSFHPKEYVNSSEMLCAMKENIHVITESTQNDLSSTLVRNAIEQKESVKYLVPDTVIQYLKENDLYVQPIQNGKEFAPFRRQLE